MNSASAFGFIVRPISLRIGFRTNGADGLGAIPSHAIWTRPYRSFLSELGPRWSGLGKLHAGESATAQAGQSISGPRKATVEQSAGGYGRRRAGLPDNQARGPFRVIGERRQGDNARRQDAKRDAIPAAH